MTVSLLVAMALVHAVYSIAAYSPRGPGPLGGSTADQIVDVGGKVEAVLIPAFSLSLAAYLLLLDRELGRRPRVGFEVSPVEPPTGT